MHGFACSPNRAIEGPSRGRTRDQGETDEVTHGGSEVSRLGAQPAVKEPWKSVVDPFVPPEPVGREELGRVRIVKEPRIKPGVDCSRVTIPVTLSSA